MNTVFLCYETDPKTGLSTVRRVHSDAIYARSFINFGDKLSRRIEEWNTDNGFLLKEFNSLSDFVGEVHDS